MYIRKCDRCGAEEQMKYIIPFFGAPKDEEVQKPKFSICTTAGGSPCPHLLPDFGCEYDQEEARE